MSLNWNMFMLVQVLIWCIVLFEWKRFKKATKTEKITFATLLTLSALMSILNLENIRGPITLLRYIFGPLGRFME